MNINVAMPTETFHFVWNCGITDERQQEMIDFFASLNDNQKLMMKEWIDNIECEIAFNQSGADQ